MASTATHVRLRGIHHAISDQVLGRWNSPKYIFGESYGTPRAAVLANMLENDRSVDVNGVIMLSQILNFDLSPDGPTGNPGIDPAVSTALPTYAATAWYHKRFRAIHHH
jgi:carboxypeptidase C (cathepsin A)